MFGSVVLRRTLAIAAGAFLVIVPSAMGQQYVAGSDGSGDPFFPKAGNGGYDVSHYSLTLDYDQPANFLSGTAVIEATATQNLRRFNLDLRDFYAISNLTVNGAPAQFARPGAQEVQINRPPTSTRELPSPSRWSTPASRRRSRTRTSRSRAGFRPTMAPTWSTSRRAHPAGTRSTTARATRRRMKSRSQCPRGVRRSRTAS